MLRERLLIVMHYVVPTHGPVGPLSAYTLHLSSQTIQQLKRIKLIIKITKKSIILHKVQSELVFSHFTVKVWGNSLNSTFT